MRTLIAVAALLATLAPAQAECWEPVVPAHELDERLFIEGDDSGAMTWNVAQAR